MDPKKERPISVIRHQSDDPFLRLRRDTAQDHRLGWRALGMLSFMLSLPVDWTFYLSHLSARREGHGNGRAATTAALKEMQAAGYLMIERVREAGRIVGTRWHVADRPIFGESSCATSSPPQVDFLNVENQTSENRPLQNKEVNIEENNNPPRQKDDGAIQGDVVAFADGSSCFCPAGWVVDLQDEVGRATDAKKIKGTEAAYAAGILAKWRKADRPSSRRRAIEAKVAVSEEAARDLERRRLEFENMPIPGDTAELRTKGAAFLRAACRRPART